MQYHQCVIYATRPDSRMSTIKAIQYAFNRFVLRRDFLTAETNGLTFRVRTTDVVGRHIYKYGQHDPVMSDYLRRTLQPADGDLLIDIGANIGWYSVLFGHATREVDAKVLCFEPDPTNYALLANNIAVNRLAERIVAKSLALADNADGATLHLFGDSNLGRHSLLPIHGGDTVDIPTARLDDVIAATAELADRTPRLIKIDIEGFEYVALQGAARTLSRCPRVVMEYSPHFMRKGDLEPAALLDLMIDAGFEPGRLDDQQRVGITRDQLLNDDRQIDLIWHRREA